MIAYHDPELMDHLDGISFIPDVSITFRDCEANSPINSPYIFEQLLCIIKGL